MYRVSCISKLGNAFSLNAENREEIDDLLLKVDAEEGIKLYRIIIKDTGETIEKTWSVDTSALVPAMIKAIQEQQALITQLQADVAALKAK